MKAAILVRVSTSKQDYDRQISDLTALALKDGFDISQIDIFGEIISGYKAYKKKESKLSELMAVVETISYKMIYVSEIPRIGRNPIEIRKVVDRLSELKIPMYIQSLNRATLNENGERDSIMNIILQVLAENAHLEIEQLKTRVTSGLLHAAKKRNLYGFRFTVWI